MTASSSRAPIGVDASGPSSDQIALHGVNDDGSCRCAAGFACRPKNRGKHPKLAPWEPGDNLGNLTGAEHGRIVIDVDVRDGDGFAELEALAGYEAPKTLMVATASGGAHFYFRHPGGVIGNGKLSPHVDVRGDKKSEDGWAYVVAPGSRIVKDDGTVAAHELDPESTIADAPEWLLVALVRRDTAKPSGAPASPPIDDMHPDFDHRVARFVDDCTKAEPARGDGSSNAKLWTLAMRAVESYRLPVDASLPVLAEHWGDRGVTRDGAPYPYEEHELRRVLENAARRADPSREIALKSTSNAFKEISRRHGGIDRGAIQALGTRVANAPEPFIAPECTETGNAELFAHLHGTNIRYVTAWNSWLVWDGQRWKTDDLGRVSALVKDVAKMRWKFVDEYGTDAKDKLELAKWAKASESRKGRENAIALAQAEDGIAVKHDALDADPWLLNVANGTLDLRTGQLRDHDRADCITKLAPITFDEGALCPTWDRFLDRITGGNVELVAFLARALGYSLTGNVGEHVMFFPFGKGRNGKSTFTLIARELLGDYAKQAAPDLLLAKHGESHATEQADLHGARFVLCQEVDQGRSWAEATLKQLTGGDRVKARRMREDFWEFEPTHKLWVCANHKPKVRGTDEGIWSRIKLVPFDVTIPKAERDTRLVEKLRAELPGILAWAVRGCLEWQRDGLGVPEEIEKATDAYRAEEDRIGAFIEEACEVGAFNVPKKELFAAYQRWAISAGESAVDMREFGSRLATRFEEGKADSGRVRTWKGIRVRSVSPTLAAQRAS